MPAAPIIERIAAAGQQHLQRQALVLRLGVCNERIAHAHDVDVEIAVAPELHLAHVADVDAGQQYRLSLLEALSPLEARVEGIASGETTTREPQRADREDCDRDGDKYADGHFVASSHA